jgi:hypothetical protein
MSLTLVVGWLLILKSTGCLFEKTKFCFPLLLKGLFILYYYIYLRKLSLVLTDCY